MSEAETQKKRLFRLVMVAAVCIVLIVALARAFTWRCEYCTQCGALKAVRQIFDLDLYSTVKSTEHSRVLQPLMKAECKHRWQSTTSRRLVVPQDSPLAWLGPYFMRPEILSGVAAWDPELAVSAAQTWMSVAPPDESARISLLDPHETWPTAELVEQLEAISDVLPALSFAVIPEEQAWRRARRLVGLSGDLPMRYRSIPELLETVRSWDPDLRRAAEAIIRFGDENVTREQEVNLCLALLHAFSTDPAPPEPVHYTRARELAGLSLREPPKTRVTADSGGVIAE